jgi:hypothetical protein
MTDVTNHPETAYISEPLVDLNSYDERKRLSGSSLVGFFKMMEIWKVCDEDARLLLGGVSVGWFSKMKRNPQSKVLGVDQMYRVSYLLGIFKGAKYPSWTRVGWQLDSVAERRPALSWKNSISVHDRRWNTGFAIRATVA